MNLEQNLAKLFGERQKQVDMSRKDELSLKETAEMERINASQEKMMNKPSVNEQVRFEAYVENIMRDLGLKPRTETDLAEEIGKFEDRYFRLRVFDQEGKPKFLKIYRGARMNQDDRAHHLNAFIREIKTAQFLKAETDIDLFRVENTNLPEGRIDPANNNPDSEVYYGLMDSTDEEAPIGFISSHEQMEKLTPEHARQAISQLVEISEKMGQGKFQLENDIHDIQDHFDDFSGYEENTKKILSTFQFEEEADEKFENYVSPNESESVLDEIRDYFSKKYPEEFSVLQDDVKNGKVDAGKYPFWLVMEYRLEKQQGRPVDFRQAVEDLLTKLKPVIEQAGNSGEYMTHGDLSPNNMYIGADNSVKFLDREWTGKSGNKLLTLVYDYGNLRARAWNNWEFRQALDQALISELGEEKGRAVISLGILRSHGNLAGFFENYDQETQRQDEEKRRKEATENDLVIAFENAGVKL